MLKTAGPVCIYSLLRTLGQVTFFVFGSYRYKPVTPRPFPIGSSPRITTPNHVDFLSTEYGLEARSKLQFPDVRDAVRVALHQTTW